MCTCTLTNAGITVLPERSTCCAPLGGVMLDCLPMAAMRPFCTTNAPFSIGGVPSPMITRAVSKTPVLIAYDKGIYKKYGLDVKLWLPKGEFPGAIETPGKMENADISVDGGVPMVSDILANKSRLIAIASTDCQVRFNIVGQKNIKTLNDVKGKRLGVSEDGAMTGFIYRVLDK